LEVELERSAILHDCRWVSAVSASTWRVTMRILILVEFGHFAALNQHQLDADCECAIYHLITQSTMV